MRSQWRRVGLGFCLWTFLLCVVSERTKWNTSFNLDLGGCPGSKEGGNKYFDVQVFYSNPTSSSPFFVRRRVCSFTGGRIASLTHGSNKDLSVRKDPVAWDATNTPGATRVRVIFLGQVDWDNLHKMNTTLEAVCGDPTTRTVIIVAGDEQCVHVQPRKLLPKACGQHIFREYYLPEGEGQSEREAWEFQLGYLPLGPRASFPHIPPTWAVRPPSKRPRLFNLVVAVATSDARATLLHDLQTEENKPHSGFILGVTKENKIKPTKWARVVLDSAFTICPGGHNPETFRLFEALEAGSIPIVCRKDFEMGPEGVWAEDYKCPAGVAWKQISEAPFARKASVGTWDDLPALLENLRGRSVEDLAHLQVESIAWYRSLMSRAYQGILEGGGGTTLGEGLWQGDWGDTLALNKTT